MKRTLAMLLLLGMLSGCTLSAGAAAQVSAPGQLPIVTEPLTLRAWAIQDGIVENLATNKTTKWAEDKTGIHIEWTAVSTAESSTQLNLSLASGDYPDMYLTDFSTDMVMTYAKYGVFLPLEEYIEEQGYYTKIVFEEHPNYRDYYTAPDGHIYTSIYTDPGNWVLAQNKMHVNTDFLKAVGLEIPQTTEEFRDMLIAFRDNDVNGNGDPNDEIPLIGSFGGISEPTGYLMNPFQVYSADYLLAQDNTVTFIANTDGWREGLKYMADLFKEGLLAEETFVQDTTQLKTLVSVADPKSRIVGVHPGQNPVIDLNVVPDGLDLYACIPPLEGPSGLRQAGTTGNTVLRLRGVITNACTEPLAAFKWMDWWLSEEATVVVDYGYEGVEYTWVDQPSINGQVPSRLRVAGDKWSSVQNDIYALNVVPHYRTPDILYSRTPTDHVPYLYKNALAYEPYHVITGLPPFIWLDDMDVINETNELAALIKDYTATNYTQFILGINDINSDAAWQAYLDGLEAIGLSRYLELKQLAIFGN